MAEYTQESFDALKERLERAKQMHAEAQKAIGEVTDGDSNVWHDNFGFDHANREEQRWRIEVSKLRKLVDEAIVIEKDAPHTSVQVGSIVIVRIDDDEETFEIAGEQNVVRMSSDGHYFLSSESPLGKALMGRSPGDAISYVLPSGARQDAEIIALS